MTTPGEARVGEVVEASTSGFVAQCHRLYDAPPLGALVRCGPADYAVYAIVGEVTTRSLDPGRRPTAVGHDEATDDDVYRRNPQLGRLLSTEITAVTVAHVAGDRLLRYLPPSPPRIHAFVSLCTAAELRRLSDSLDFLPGVLAAPVASPDDVAAAFLRQAADVHDDREAFLVAAGRDLAALLGTQIPRLNSLLKRLAP